MISPHRTGIAFDTPTGIDNHPAANIPAQPTDAEQPVVTPLPGTHLCSRPPADVPVQGQVHRFSAGTPAMT
jgi:hypothetical protein